MKKSVIMLIGVALAGLAAAAWSAEEGGWPCFHGARRDNKSVEAGLLQSWPKEGPALVWTASGLGHGYSSVAVAGGRVFTAGVTGKKTWVVALDMNGKQLWRKENGESWEASKQQTWAVPYSGARGTPTVDGDTVYHLSDLGRLAALDVRNGEERWHVDLVKTFNAPRAEYGYAESVLILGDRLICCPGGAENYIVALDKRSGKTLWAGTGLKDEIGYASPVVATIGGVEQVISVSAAHIFAVNAENGQLLWKHPFSSSRTNNATDVIVQDGLVYGSSGYGKGSVLLRPQRRGDGQFTVEEVWTSKLLDNHHGGVLLLDGYLYGSGHEAKGWFCLKLENGGQCWQTPGKGSLTYADHRLYCLDEKGTMMLVEPNPEKWSVVGSFNVPSGGHGSYWAHPVVCGGRLYVRHSEKLFVYRVGGK